MFWYALYHTFGYMLAFAVVGYTAAWLVMLLETLLNREFIIRWAEKKAEQWGAHNATGTESLGNGSSGVRRGTGRGSSNDG